jgi:hypothetical protein
MTLAQIGEASNSLGRDGVVKANEFRQKLGMKPSDDPMAEQLINSNIKQPSNGIQNGGVIQPEERSEESY